MYKVILVSIKLILLIYSIDLIFYFIRIKSVKESEELLIGIIFFSVIFFIYGITRFKNWKKVILRSVLLMMILIFCTKVFSDGDLLLDGCKRIFNTDKKTAILIIITLTGIILIEDVSIKILLKDELKSKNQKIEREDILDSNFT